MNWIKFVKSKNTKFYLVYFSLCLIFAILVVEVSFNLVTISSGVGAGSASKRWFNEYWTPINADGYRDFDVSINKNQKTILFLGDSFTAGHGVKLQETYYFFMRERLSSQFNLVNLGENGSNTQRQLVNLKLFLSKYDVQPRYIVHQYFVNDIADYIEPINVQKSSLRRALADVSEAFNFVDTYFFISEFTSKYSSQLNEAYGDKDILEKHLSDLKKIHQLAYEKKSNIVLILFPFLNGDEQIKTSSTYTQRIKESFLHSCKKDDILIDVSPLASSLDTNERVVNLMDAHPSPRLHRMVGELLFKGLSREGGEFVNDGLIRCRQ